MYRIGICDDDRVFCADLEEKICRIAETLPEKAEVEVWYSGEGLLGDISRGESLDLLFLDIELVQKNGIQVGRFIREDMDDIRTHIVYVSSREGYAMQLFRIQPLDFLVKPVTEERLREVLLRSMRQKRGPGAWFAYQSGGDLRRIPAGDILYFMSMDKKIRMVSRDGEAEFYGRLKEICRQLPGDFWTIHQSYVINRQYVSEYAYDSVKMSDGTVLSISKPYRKEVRSRIQQLRKAELYV